MRVLGLDIGEKRIGIAFSDGETVGSFPTVKFFDRDQAVSKILEICRSENVEKIVLGLPRNGSNTASEDLVRSFAMELRKTSDKPIEFVDETLTSKEAERLLLGSGFDPKSEEYKKEIDRLSAKMILEQFLKEKIDE